MVGMEMISRTLQKRQVNLFSETLTDFDLHDMGTE